MVFLKRQSSNRFALESDLKLTSNSEFLKFHKFLVFGNYELQRRLFTICLEVSILRQK
ncbi:hypothetical protein SAMN03080617_02713 [Algoriphagus alkaliphilus]|uniref:Uncharacterized protein n=1 Tax=Algoriphagus alkaliphilus TaxID=279824 RepID=A0A1G5YQ48_9BACT|nr:hypothetical protein SAMN03080617_02713 [Algoriphagus alkaliphilus]